MGIHGLLKHLGSGERTSLATFAAQHYVKHGRPLRLAIDIAIWLFQIQAGQGGSNPALRTFYYRLLRLISLNIHPLFVFDGPNKPLFKRNRKVGGPGVRVATVPEFLAKQLLKQFGFPMHIAPGEAEAECALLQRESVVDAVLSEDVDTMMFGSKMTLRNWTAQGSNKTPSHIDVYNSTSIEAASGLDGQGMILVALMSGGDYIPEGIPGCGPTIAVAAARAGYGKRLCALTSNDKAGLRAWREELQMELRTNTSKYFSRKNSTLVVPADFPNFEVFGYYTNPSISTMQKVATLKHSLKWDLPLDLPALRSFAGDAFDWHFRGGAIKFIRNLAPSLLIRELRLASEHDRDDETQAILERRLLKGIHGVREHIVTDKSPEIRVSYIPADLVPVDLSSEPVEEASGDQQDQVSDDMLEVDADQDEDVPQTPSRRKRTFRPYEEGEAERIWILREWAQLGCPAMLEDYEEKLRASKRPAVKPTKKGKKGADNASMPENALLKHMRVSKQVFDVNKRPSDALLSSQSENCDELPALPEIAGFKKPIKSAPSQPSASQAPRTPSRRKRRTEELLTPGSGQSDITRFFSPRESRQPAPEVISLLSSSPTRSSEHSVQGRPALHARPRKTLKPANDDGSGTLRERSNNISSHVSTLHRRSPGRGLQKSLSVPTTDQSVIDDLQRHDAIECLDLAESPAQLRTFAPVSRVTEPPKTQTCITGGFKAARQLIMPAKPKFAIKLRESLDGAWSAVAADTIDLSGNTDHVVGIGMPSIREKSWRLSGVDTLDLT